ncbi:MAG: glucosamine-6-phosphate isomerase [Spirochaetia bacterium]|jgi:glucosamine-6-phosphate deaminase|nr:glucosamine-6-phosphate isomerase [Spirochaetia bacterium]
MQNLMDVYRQDLRTAAVKGGIQLEILETDIDLYWRMALSMYLTIKDHSMAGRRTTMILPVGPVFQYRRFLALLRESPLDLSEFHCFFMDEYLAEDGTLIPEDSPLSFRGFIKRELIAPMPAGLGFRKDQVHFPDPADPGKYDKLIVSLGGIDLCHAGVGINGHLAFNEPPESGGSSSSTDGEFADGEFADGEFADGEFADIPTRVVALSRETRTINANTALRGAYEQVPSRAVTVGMKQILASRKLRIYLNRPWQAAVIRKALFLEPTARFPVTLARNHRDLGFLLTELVAEEPQFGLR